LRISERHRSPLVLGFRHPVVLLPAPTLLELDPTQTDQIIAHELAHVRRRDDWLNLLQQLIQAALFFHPAVAWISKRLSLEREIASDDLVLQEGGQGRAYARLLLNLASRRQVPTPWLAPGASASTSQLQQRITMILNTHRSISPRLAKARLSLLTSGALLAAVLALICGPRLVLAHNADAAPSPATVAEANSQGADTSTATAVAQPTVTVHSDVDTVTTPEVRIKTRPVRSESAQVDFVDVTNDAAQDPASGDSGPKFKKNPNRNDETSELFNSQTSSRIRFRDGKAQHGSIEERLDRLEKMVQELSVQQNTRRTRLDRQMTQLDAQKQSLKELEELKALPRNSEVREADEVKRAAREAEKAMKMEAVQREKAGWQEGFQAQIKVLEKQRESLQREMEKLERQMERIRRDHERMQEKQHRDQSDGNDSDGNRAKEPGR